MAEIDTTPLESVRTAVDLFDRGIDHQSSRLSPSPHGNEEDQIAILTKELEARARQHEQATAQIEALQRSVQELSCQYERECTDAHLRIAQLEAENTGRQSAADGECEALRFELAAVKADLAHARASVAFVLREVEAMETRAVLERESTRDALARILQLNETVLSSAVAAIRAEEERSVFFQEATMQFFDSDRNLEVVRRQMEMMEGMEMELLAKTVEVEFLRAELMQAKEIYVSPSPQGDSSDAATTTVVVSAAGCSSDLDDGRRDQPVQVLGRCEEMVEGRTDETEPEFTFPHSPGVSFVSDEIFRKDCHAVLSGDGSKTEIDMSEGLAENKQGAAGVMVEDTTVAEGNSHAQETRRLVVARVSGEDHHAIEPRGKSIEADTDSNNQDHHHVETSNADDASFVLEISRDDFQSVVHTDAKAVIVSITAAEPDNVATAANQEQEPRRAEPAAAPTTSIPRERSSDTRRAFATEIVSKDEDEFYNKELEPEPGQGTTKRLGADVSVRDDKRLEEARTEISDLRFSLEDAVRRAELAEEGKAALERELREEIRSKQRTPSSRRRAASDSEEGRRPGPATAAAAREEGARPSPTTPARPRPTPAAARTSGTPRCLTLGKVLNMKYK